MFSIFVIILPLYLVNAQSQKTSIWSQSFTTGVISTACQCQNWLDFWQFWIGDPSQVLSITLSGSLSATTYTCSGSAAQFVAFALATPPYETTRVTCESGIWYTSTNAAATGNAVSLMATVPSCTTNPAMRPCWHNVNWGGVGTANCAPPTQTLTVAVVSNIPTLTVPPASVAWTDSFADSVSSTSTQCNNWRQFWQDTVPRSNTLSVTLVSSVNGGVSAICSGPGVNLLATALFTPTSNGQYHCNEGTVWYFNGLFGANPNMSAIQIGGPPTNCTSALSLRPCWVGGLGNNWGGFGGVNCNAASQTFTATITIGANTITTNTCWQQLNVAISTGIFTVGCNYIMLQCITNYVASAYEPSSSGLYTCSNAVWSPAVPTCIGEIGGLNYTVCCLVPSLALLNSALTTTSTTASTTTTSTTTPTTTSSITTTATTNTSTTSITFPTSTTLTTTSSTTTPATTSSSTTTNSTFTTTPSQITTSTYTTTTTITPTTTTTCVTTTTYAESVESVQASGSGMLSSNLVTLPVADLTAFLAGETYSSSDYPRSYSDAPTEIDVSVQISKLSSVSESSNTFDVDLSVTLAWVDQRLNYAKGNGTMTSGTFQLTNANDQDLLWRPTLFIVNAEKVFTPMVFQKNTVSFILPDGTVILQQRALATVNCPMSLSNYPFDTQKCFIQFSLYGYFASQLTLYWKYPAVLEAFGQNNSSPLAVPPDFSLPNFDIQKIVIGMKGDNNSQDVYCGKYRPCLFVQFALGRKVSYHVIRTYLPSTFVLIVSWISFWIHPQNVPARFGLGITTFLTLQTTSANTQARLPTISYLTALDVWLLYCQISVFLCLVEFTFVHTLTTGLWSYNGVKSGFVGLFSMANTKSTQTPATMDITKGKCHGNSTATETVGPAHQSTSQNRLDYVSRRIFPLSFFVFLIVYLAHYLA